MRTTLTIDDMNCDGCVAIITGAVEAVDGVEDVTADLEEKTVVVEGEIDLADLRKAIELSGYEATVVDPAGDE